MSKNCKHITNENNWKYIEKNKQNKCLDLGVKSEENSPDDFKVLSQLHSDMVEFKQKQMDIFFNKNIIYKQHIPPTHNNIKLLGGKKVVVLLGEVENIVLSYRRAYYNRGYHLRNKKWFSLKMTESEFLDKSKDIGLYDDILKFNKSWRESPCDKIIVYKKDLLNNPVTTINRILLFMNLPTVDDIRLVKSNLSL